MSTVHVFAKLIAPEGKGEELKGPLTALAIEVKKEKGCIKYDLHQDLESPHFFWMIEEWTTAEDLAEHAKITGPKTALLKEKGLLAGAEVFKAKFIA